MRACTLFISLFGLVSALGCGSSHSSPSDGGLDGNADSAVAMDSSTDGTVDDDGGMATDGGIAYDFTWESAGLPAAPTWG